MLTNSVQRELFKFHLKYVYAVRSRATVELAVATQWREEKRERGEN